jgi:transposase-like protein
MALLLIWTLASKRETDMNAHSKDLRQRILNHALTHSIRQTARLFQVSPDTVYRLKKLYYKTGDITPHAKLLRKINFIGAADF